MALNINFNETIGRFEYAMQRKLLFKSTFYKKVFGGKGFEFESFKEYVPGQDDSNMIDWKASMKTSGEFLVRQYIEERDLNVFFIIDVGDNMVLGSGNKLKAETAAEICSCISHLILISGDKIGFTLYNNKISALRPFSPGLNQFHTLVKFLADPKNYGGRSDLVGAVDYVKPYLKKASTVFIISDFLNVDEDTANTLKKLAAMHETIGIMIRDRVDNQLSDLKGEVVIEDIRTGQQVLIDPNLIKGEYERHADEQRRRINELFLKIGADIIEITNNEDFIMPLVSFLKRRINRRGFNR